jgi:hypothetical protein
MKRKFETISQNNEDLEQNEPASKKRRLIAGPVSIDNRSISHFLF